MVQDHGSGVGGDPAQVVLFNIPGRVDTAAQEDGILDAGGHEAAKLHFQRFRGKTFQQAILRFIHEVGQIILVDTLYRPARLLHQQQGGIGFLSRTKALCQRPGNAGMVFLPQLPQGRLSCPFYLARVCYVKDIFQPGGIALPADERNPF